MPLTLKETITKIHNNKILEDTENDINFNSIILVIEIFIDKFFQEREKDIEKFKTGLSEAIKDGKKGLSGKDGINGKDGKQGEQGLSGKDGTNGVNGKDGKMGLKGIAGTDGKDGNKGKDGVSGKNGKNGSPDTSRQIINKINDLEESISIKTIRGLPEAISMLGKNIRLSKQSKRIGGGGSAKQVDVETVSANTTLNSTHYTILANDDTAGTAITITLPESILNTRRIYHIKKIGNTANVVIDGNGSETIDGGTTATLTIQYESIKIICDGNNWHIL